MPALSPTMTVGNLAKWLKKEGDKITAGSTLAEIETDKATMEYESTEEGVLAKILINEGSNEVAVGTPMFVLAPIGMSDDNIREGLKNLEIKSSKVEAKINEKKYEVPVSTKQNAGDKHEIQSNDQQSDKNNFNDHRLKMSPIAKQIMSTMNIDPTQINGSGPMGRIVKSDVVNIVGQKMAETGGRNIQPSNKSFSRRDPDRQEITVMRKVIAERLTASKNGIPHFYLKIECKMDELLAMRVKLNEGKEVLVSEIKGAAAINKITVNDFMVKVVAKAMEYTPEMNVSWQGDHISKYNNIDVSVAVAIENGLITPIVENANLLSLEDISLKVKDLVARAKTGKLKPAEFQGGSITISNLGMFDIDEFSAIINSPQSSILAIGATKRVPVVDGDTIEIANMVNIVLSGDHRVIDGAIAAKFLKKIKYFIENPLLLAI